jgi:ABC-type proline/glycine betaine transport system ATPase subunit
MFLTSLAKQVSGVQAAHDLTVRNMNITGEIALVRHGYIIRGKVPAEIFTILNPDPKVLDKFVTSGKTVKIQVRIVSGDNVEIVKLAGMNYLDETSGAQSVQDCTVRIMSITGEIAQASNGYIIRGSVPAEVFTILNPDPKILDKFVTSGKTVKIQVRIVSGGNVEIKMIDGKKYLNKSQ